MSRNAALSLTFWGVSLRIYVSSARPHDTTLAPILLQNILPKYPSISCLALDKGYRGTTVNFIKNTQKKSIIPEPKEGQKVSSKRWALNVLFLGPSTTEGFRKIMKQNQKIQRFLSKIPQYDEI